MLRILHTTASLDSDSGGPARSVPQLAAAQAVLGHEISIWCADSPVHKTDGRLHIVGRPLNDLLGDSTGFDLVHDHGIWQPFHHHVARLCKKHATPRVLSPRGMLEPWALGHKRMKKKLAWWLYQEKDLQTASALHATAAAEALQFRGLGFEMPLFVRPNGIEVPESFSRKKLSSKPSLEGGARTALFLSRIHLKKGLDMWVEAWSAVRPEGWNMRVVGPDAGGHRRAIEAQVKAAGLADSWSFSGPLEGDDKWRAMRAADLFILPTRSENFGIVVAEALGVGVPVITTTAAPWEGLEHHACGWWVAPEADALAIALGQATELSTDALGNMGERGRAWVEEAFSWPVIAAAMLASYQKVLMEHR